MEYKALKVYMDVESRSSIEKKKDIEEHESAAEYHERAAKHHRKALQHNNGRIFGSLLAVLGIGGLIFAAVIFIHLSGCQRYTNALVIYGAMGLIFFASGINMRREALEE